MVKNIDYFLKRIIAFGWDILSTKRLKAKFKLYGPYKKVYKWSKYEKINAHKALYIKYGFKVNSEWYKYFTLVRQEENPFYLPEDIWHVKLEPVLNHRSFAKAFNDKNLFHLLDYKELFPFAFAHVIEGVCYDTSFNAIDKHKLLNLIPSDKPFVVKKSIDTGGGKGVKLYDSKELISLDLLFETHGNNFVIQEKVVQHQWFEQFNATSVNTIRVVTYRSVRDEKVHVIQTLFRVGKKGSFVDNQSSGGIAIGIDTNGRLNSWGTDKLSEKFSVINGVEINNSIFIPDYNRLLSTCIDLAKKRFHERVLVFDTWRDVNNNIRLLEINNINIGIEDLQKNNGPLFGDFTEEILDYCSKNPRSFCLDFEI